MFASYSAECVCVCLWVFALLPKKIRTHLEREAFMYYPVFVAAVIAAAPVCDQKTVSQHKSVGKQPQ